MVHVGQDIYMDDNDIDEVGTLTTYFLVVDSILADDSTIDQLDAIRAYDSGLVYYPRRDYPDGGIIGHSSYRFNALYAQTVFEGDQVFMEKSCPLCDNEFKEGEALVSYVLSNTEEGTRCIPVHLICISKSENQTKIKHDLVIQKLKDTEKYIDPIIEIAKMKEIGTKLEINLEVKMEKITLKDGKKGIVISKKGHFKVFSEEELIGLEKRCLDKLAEIQKYLNELNK